MVELIELKVNYECASCMLRQSREAIEHATDDHEKRMDVTLKVLEHMHHNFVKNNQSNKTGTDLHHMIMDATGNHDPYGSLREEGNRVALKLVPMAQKLLEEDDSLENYCRIAVAGNVIDFGAMEEGTDMESLIKKQIKVAPVLNDVDKLGKSLEKADKILYLADNGGEIVFDKLLIEKIKKDYDVDIYLALKDGPILNDALIPDAEKLGLGEYANIISTGASSVGIVEEYLSGEFRELMDSVDLIISKGMGNFEGLTEMTLSTPVFFLFTTKCNVISRNIGVPVGSPVIVEGDLSS